MMGLIYVNPEGVDGKPDPLKTAADVRETFARMAMNDEENRRPHRGGHTVGKCPRQRRCAPCLGPDPEGAGVENRLGWMNPARRWPRRVTSGIEGAWTTHPTKMGQRLLRHAARHEWELKKSRPAPGSGNRSTSRRTECRSTSRSVHPPQPDHDRRRHGHEDGPGVTAPSPKVPQGPGLLSEVFARAWFKLTHRDMGPKARYIGPDVPAEDLIWQDRCRSGHQLRRGAVRTRRSPPAA